jgi:hypothetical protein
MVALVDPSDAIEVALVWAVSAAAATEVVELVLLLELELVLEAAVPWNALSPLPPQAVRAAVTRNRVSLEIVRIVIPVIDRFPTINRC